MCPGRKKLRAALTTLGEKEPGESSTWRTVTHSRTPRSTWRSPISHPSTIQFDKLTRHAVILQMLFSFNYVGHLGSPKHRIPIFAKVVFILWGKNKSVSDTNTNTYDMAQVKLSSSRLGIITRALLFSNQTRSIPWIWINFISSCDAFPLITIYGLLRVI